MAPPPFKIPGDPPKPLTITQTAQKLGVSADTLRETLAAVERAVRSVERGGERTSAAGTKVGKAGKVPARPARKRAKAVKRPARRA